MMTQVHEKPKGTKLTRRTLMISAGAAAGVRAIPKIATASRGRPILRLYFDKVAGAMRAIERIVP